MTQTIARANQAALTADSTFASQEIQWKPWIFEAKDFVNLDPAELTNKIRSAIHAARTDLEQTCWLSAATMVVDEMGDTSATTYPLINYIYIMNLASSLSQLMKDANSADSTEIAAQADNEDMPLVRLCKAIEQFTFKLSSHFKIDHSLFSNCLDGLKDQVEALLEVLQSSEETTVNFAAGLSKAILQNLVDLKK